MVDHLKFTLEFTLQLTSPAPWPPPRPGTLIIRTSLGLLTWQYLAAAFLDMDV